jgi:hypothetical protein
MPPSSHPLYWNPVSLNDIVVRVQWKLIVEDSPGLCEGDHLVWQCHKQAAAMKQLVFASSITHPTQYGPGLTRYQLSLDASHMYKDHQLARILPVLPGESKPNSTYWGIASIWPLVPPLGTISRMQSLSIIFAMTPIFWSFWLLGRKTNMSPFQTARAFHAPVVGEAPLITETPILLREAGLQRVHRDFAHAPITWGFSSVLCPGVFCKFFGVKQWGMKYRRKIRDDDDGDTGGFELRILARSRCYTIINL